MQLVHVAVAVIKRGSNVLIARRPEHVHQGGLWEFPGGKVEKGETVQQALRRELKEELDIVVDIQSGVQPLMRIQHDYGDKRVLLDVWLVTQFSGEAKGMEGQPVKWVEENHLAEFDFPEANQAIIAAIVLPQKYLITGDFSSAEECLDRLRLSILNHDIKMVQFRCHELRTSNPGAYRQLVDDINIICKESGVLLILNAPPSTLQDIDADGIHLTFSEARNYTARPTPKGKWLGVSCHTAEELMWAKALDPDYVLLSPVKKTKTHPEAEPLGWPLFRELSDSAPFPVFALGGMGEADMLDAIDNGAQGIAAITTWW